MNVFLIGGLAALLYTYVIYPLLLALLPDSRTEGGDAAEADFSEEWPRVAILLSVYNEEARIGAKIDNFRRLDYPGEKLELWIGSDGSTDRTAEMVRAAGDERIRLVRAERGGKSAMLNRLAGRTEAEVLVFTDANAMLRSDAIRALVKALGEHGAGLVSGRTVVRGEDGSGDVEGAYYRYERWLKTRESGHGRLAGADGALYAMKRKLWEDLPPELINDFAHPWQVALRGFRARFTPAAVCEEAADGSASQEFQRQTRMVAQALRVYFRYIGPAVGAGDLRLAWTMTSHKLLRWLGLVWMACIFSGTAWMARENSWAMLFLAAQVAALSLAGVTALFPKRFECGLCRFPLYFLLVHAAYFRGVLKYLAGERYVTWQPRAG